MSGDFKGVLTTLNHALPAGLDGTRIAQWRMRDGTTYPELKAMIAAAMDDFNSELLNTYGDMIYVGDTDFLEYTQGGTVSAPEEGASGQRAPETIAQTVGHSIDLKWWQKSLVGDPRWFRDTRKAVVGAQLKYITQSFRDQWERTIFTRFFTTTENALGANGWDVPFANANPNINASNGLGYIPMSWGGQTFTTSHTHYLGFDSGSSKTFADVFNDLAKTVNEHGNNGPYVAYISESDVKTITGLDFYVKPTNPIITNIDRGGLTSGNTFFMDGLILGTPALGGRFCGAYNTGYGIVGLYATYRLPTGYVGLYKSYGVNDPRNPLYVRIHPDFGFGARVQEIPDFGTTYPLKEILTQIEYGVSSGPGRVGGAVGYLVSGGTFVNPTIN